MAAQALVVLLAAAVPSGEAWAAPIPQATTDSAISGRTFAVSLPDTQSVGDSIEQNYDADDGELSDSVGVSFGRALDLKGSPLRLAPIRPKSAGTAMFAPGLYTGPFIRPSGLPVRIRGVSSGFGTRWHPLLGAYRFHAGIDLVAPAGSPILATSPGVVTEAGWCGGYGYCVTLDHGRGLHTLYGHLSQFDVTFGERVSAGQQLGLVGSTGLSTGPHLHYEVRVNGRPVDPRAYLGR